MENTDEVVDGVVYERADSLMQIGDVCKGCVGAKNSNLCDYLNSSSCGSQYIFKVKDIQKASEPSQGVKYDENKTLYSLVPPHALEAVAKNLTVGLQKYKEVDNWKKVPDAESRYLNALYRHLEAHRKGEIYDTENIDPTTTHMSAVAVNSLFLLELMLNPTLKLNKGGNK